MPNKSDHSERFPLYMTNIDAKLPRAGYLLRLSWLDRSIAPRTMHADGINASTLRPCKCDSAIGRDALTWINAIMRRPITHAPIVWTENLIRVDELRKSPKWTRWLRFYAL
jgi:hypothetical protein